MPVDGLLSSREPVSVGIPEFRDDRLVQARSTSGGRASSSTRTSTP